MTSHTIVEVLEWPADGMDFALIERPGKDSGNIRVGGGGGGKRGGNTLSSLYGPLDIA